MALTNAAKVGTQGYISTSKPVGLIRVSVDFDNPYVPGTGYANFIATTVKGISGFEGITAIAVPDQFIAAGGTYYLVHWVRSTDTLLVINPATGAEIGAVSLAAFTSQELVVHVQ